MNMIKDVTEGAKGFIKRNITLIICIAIGAVAILFYLDSKSDKVAAQNGIVAQEVALENSARDNILNKYNGADPELLRTAGINAVEEIKNSTQYKNLERQYAKLESEQSNLNTWLAIFLFVLGSILSAGIIELELYFMTKLNFIKMAETSECSSEIIGLIKTMYAINFICWTLITLGLTIFIK